MNNCPKCGKEVKDDDNFCKYCGAPISEKTASTEVALASPDDVIKNVIIKRLDGIKNKDENAVRSIIDAGRYSKFDDWPPYSRQDADTALKNEFGAFQVLSNYNYDFTNFKVDVIGDVAIATFQLHYTGEMSKRPFEVNSRITTILLKQDAEWKIIHEHYSRWGEEQRGDAGQQQRRRRRWGSFPLISSSPKTINLIKPEP
jgi:ketosteroid isomerase-like protein